ncbi:MAG: hypothetical protein IPN86_03235 [Saprospiraceae bacterium]|nr:hypothetical protein [Saprospiraceae bacterium]
MYTAESIAQILGTDLSLLSDKSAEIRFLSMDTRKIDQAGATLFLHCQEVCTMVMISSMKL